MSKTSNKALPVVIACIFVQLCMGILYLWSVFRSPVVEFYSWNNASANMVSSYMMMAFMSAHVIGGFIQDKTHPRLVAAAGCCMFCGGIFLTSLLSSANIGLLYLTYCVVGGLGSGFAYVSVVTCIVKWFPHRRGFASGIATAAFGLSTVVFAPLSKWLLGSHTVPQTFRILAAIFFAVSIISCLFIRLPSEEYLSGIKLPAAKIEKAKARDYNPAEMLRTSSFWCIALFAFLSGSTWVILIPLIKDLGVSRGLSEALAVTTVSLTGITNTAGRLIMSNVSDRIGRVRTTVVLSVINTAAAAGLIFAGGPLYMIFVLLAAFGYGSGPAITPALMADLFGLKYAGTNMGFISICSGLSSIVFVKLSNALYASTDAYTASFIMAACCVAAPIFIMSVLDRRLKTLKR